MMKRARKFAVLAAVSMLAVAACGDDDDGPATDDGDSETTDASDDDTEAPEDTEPEDPTATTAADAATTTEASDDGGESDASLTVYSGRGEDLVQPIIDQFVDETGIDVAVRYGDSAEMLLLLQQEGENSPADVFYSQGAGFLGTLSESDGLAELDSSILDLVPAELQSPSGDWVGLSGRARVAVYNPDEMDEGDLPDSVLDFTDDEWAGQIGYAPSNASFQDFVTALRTIEGEDGAREWLEGIVANGVPYENNTAIVEAVAAGEVQVGLSNHYYLYRYLAEDPDFAAANKYYSDGDPGALINVAGAGVLASSDHPDEAAQLVEYLLSTEAQEYFAEETYEIPVVEGVDTSADLPSLDTLTLPDFDLNALLDLEGTTDLLIELGALD